MTESLARRNALDLEQELAWFSRVVDARFEAYFGGGESRSDDVPRIAPPDLGESDSPYAQFLRRLGPEMTFVSRLALVLGLVPHVRPRLLDVFYTRNSTFDRRFTEFGGDQDRADGEFAPTGETLAFLFGGESLEARFTLQQVFEPDHFFARHGVLRLVPGDSGSPSLKSRLELDAEYVSLFTTGVARRPEFGAGFPAEYIETQLTWDDVVLARGTYEQVQEITTWLRHGSTLMDDWGMAPKLRPGHRSLFYGPPGTGKTMTACLLGRSTGREVYKIDLSLVVSKFVGETEKNLARVFDRAEHKAWILFFDEADALFGKRTEARDAHDRYANQQVSYLLQRIESFDGVVILASNFHRNVDEAFSRRFESIVYFPMPRPEERLDLWRKGFSEKARFEGSLDLDAVAREHELSGGSIMNVIRFASLQALEDGGRAITMSDVLRGVRREYAKEGKAG